MKYTIMGFSQEKMMEFELDMIDLVILRWFVDFKGTNKMIEEKFDGKTYYWVDYSSIIKEYPAIKINNVENIRRRMKKMQDKGILIHRTRRKGGSYSFYNIGDKYIELIYEPSTQKSIGVEAVDSKVDSSRPKSRQAVDSKVGTKHPSTNKSFYKNPSTKTTTTEEQGNNVVVDETFLNKFKKDFKERYKCTLIDKYLLEMYFKKGKDILLKYFDNFQLIINSYIENGKEIKSIGGLFKKAVIDEFEIPKTVEAKPQSYKPPQSTNYDQREYDDEFFNSCYDNVKFIKKE